MKLPLRLAYFGGGFIVGLAILFFFLGGKKTSCDYGMDARVLKNIRIKKRVINENVLSYLKEHQLDTAKISEILNTGDIDFSKSDQRKKPCGIYVITSKEHSLKVENCNTTATFIAMSNR